MLPSWFDLCPRDPLTPRELLKSFVVGFLILALFPVSILVAFGILIRYIVSDLYNS